MKIMHISDLHLGKKVNEVSMIEEQEYILKKILEVLDEEKPEVLLIAGDIYDKPVPPVQAVNLLDDFICELSKIIFTFQQVLMIMLTALNLKMNMEI